MWLYIGYNVLITIPVIFALSAADAILTAAGLSYLGLGIQLPTPDWGLDLSVAQQFLTDGVWWTSFFPGLMIIRPGKKEVHQTPSVRNCCATLKSSPQSGVGSCIPSPR